MSSIIIKKYIESLTPFCADSFVLYRSKEWCSRLSLFLDARIRGGSVTRPALVKWLRSYHYFSRCRDTLNDHRVCRVAIAFATIGNRTMRVHRRHQCAQALADFCPGRDRFNANVNTRGKERNRENGQKHSKPDAIVPCLRNLRQQHHEYRRVPTDGKAGYMYTDPAKPLTVAGSTAIACPCRRSAAWQHTYMYPCSNCNPGCAHARSDEWERE